jgi:UDPglucose 6-dehydrogenase
VASVGRFWRVWRTVRIAVIGTGHVGLTTCVTLAALGHDVGGTDADAAKIDRLARGEPPLFEPGLEDLLREHLASGRLSFARGARAVVPDAEVAFICVGTPPRADGEASLLAVERSAREVAANATGPLLVVEKSTVPAGTAERLKGILAATRPEIQFDIASNPEFLREGSAVRDAMAPDRILVGAETPRAFELMRRVYEPLIAAGCPLVETSIATAELAKHACNAFLALKISFANAMAAICERAGADVTAVADVMGLDRRIGRAFLDAGLGYGGFCFPKDLAAFERLADRLGVDLPLLREIVRINDAAVAGAVAKIREALWNLEDKRICLLGLAFKPNTDDVRYSPALALARALMDAGARVVGFDPAAGANAREELPALEIAASTSEAARAADCVVVCTEWPEFRTLDLAALRSVVANPVIVDGRNLLDPAAVADAGFAYHPTGRPSVQPTPAGPAR